MRYNVLLIGVFVVFVGVAYGRVGAQSNNQQPPQADIDSASESADLLAATLFAALLQEFAETTPANVEQGKKSIGLVFDDANHNIRLVGDLAPLSDNDLPEERFEVSALTQAKVGQGTTSVERVKGKWYYRRSIALSNFHPACGMCHSNFGSVNSSQFVGALMTRVPIGN